MRGPLASSVQGLPRVASTCWWLVDRNRRFQLELFQFERPLARLMPHDFRPSDIGYTRIGVWVGDFDQALTRLERLGSSPLSAPVGAPGERRACVRNPDGVYVEVMEDDPLSGAGLDPARSSCPVALRSVTLSVPDLARSEAFFGGIGLGLSDAELRVPEHEALWGLAGARTQGSVFSAGDALVEVVQYLRPGRAGAPGGLPDLGSRHPQHRLRSAEQARPRRPLPPRPSRRGAAQRRPLHLPGAGVVSLNDPQRFSVELLWIPELSISASASPRDRCASDRVLA